jgi:predicted ABC-type transport system involved in lysophospholipase L1 biosynthesis ATPase subunit
LMEELHTKRNVTLVLVTHDADLAGKAQRRVALRDGEVVDDSLNR